MSVWRRMLGRKHCGHQVTAAEPSRAAPSTPSSDSGLARGAPTKACLACRRRFNALLAICPYCGSSEAMPADSPDWFALMQVHVNAVQANDRAVRLFRAGELDEAIAELHGSLDVYAQYATGHSNLGFLYLWKGDLDHALACLLRALDVDPHHKEAPDHLMDVLRALTDELVQIGCTDGFLSTRPGGLFDERNRHRRARTIGTLVAAMGQGGVFNVDGRVLEQDRLMQFVIKDVENKLDRPWVSTALAFVWQDIDEWCPAATMPLPQYPSDTEA